MTQPTAGKPWLAEFILLSAIWGSSFLFTRLGAAQFGALPTAGLRVGIASVCLMPLILSKGLWPELNAHPGKLFILGMFNSAIPFACFAFALLTLASGLTSLLNATVPLFGALIAWMWLKDRPRGLKILGLLIGFSGVAMLAWGKASFKPDARGLSSGWAVIACLFACLCYGIAASFTRRHLQGVSPLVIATGSQIGATVGLAIPTYVLWPATSPTGAAWLSLLALGVLCTGVAYVLFFRLIERIGAAGTLTVTFVIPVFAVIYGVIFLNEAVTSWMLICGAIIFCGTALSLDLFRRNYSRQSRPPRRIQPKQG